MHPCHAAKPSLHCTRPAFSKDTAGEVETEIGGSGAQKETQNDPLYPFHFYKMYDEYFPSIRSSNSIVTEAQVGNKLKGGA